MKPRVKKEAVAYAKRIEEKYGVTTSVIAQTNQGLPWVTSGDGITIFVIEPRKDNFKILKQLAADLEVSSFGQPRHLVQGMHPVSEMVAITRENPSLLRSGLGAAGFLVPFLTHTEIFGKYQDEFRRAFQTAFGPALVNELRERKERLKKFQQQRLQRVRMARTAEQKQLLDQFEALAQRVHAEQPTVLIALDRSGRPVGTTVQQILKEAYGERIPLFFINPEMLRNTTLPKQTLRKLLETQHPHLCRHLPDATVMILDDQIATGKAAGAVGELLNQFHPKKVKTEVLSEYPKTHPPSWWYQKPFLIQSAKGRLISKRIRANQKLRRKSATIRKKFGKIARTLTIRLRKK
ncbi:MAG: phosphoribosyltransferase [Candidatus Diapherotrites archaeon]|uniref:Phosphoribosyltransferase n=1 Tax=Candidatus Iainarchaeum sp. TaxID=3101447 RepID=A0A8T4L880_9ARCH|nr:phosphoribosyltransferase [Candidatus Diapherotrites archaeon]